MALRIVCTSDWHGRPPMPTELPECDLLLMAGDYGIRANDLELWLMAAGICTGVVKQRRIAIAGNHDFMIEKTPTHYRDFISWTYLRDDWARVLVPGTRRTVKVWGSPWSPTFFDWAFQKDDEDLADVWKLIPDDTEILLTHGPPEGKLDLVPRGERVGSKTLAARIRELPKLKLHVFGHIHEQSGQSYDYASGVLYVNASAGMEYVEIDF